jgi:hypothetical protein
MLCSTKVQIFKLKYIIFEVVQKWQILTSVVMKNSDEVSLHLSLCMYVCMYVRTYIYMYVYVLIKARSCVLVHCVFFCFPHWKIGYQPLILTHFLNRPRRSGHVITFKVGWFLFKALLVVLLLCSPKHGQLLLCGSCEAIRFNHKRMMLCTSSVPIYRVYIFYMNIK